MAKYELGAISSTTEEKKTIATFEGTAIRRYSDSSVTVLDENAEQVAIVYLRPGQWIVKVSD